jgi:hypothetical protein
VSYYAAAFIIIIIILVATFRTNLLPPLHNDYGGRMFVYQTAQSHMSGYLYLIEVLRTFPQHPKAVSFHIYPIYPS